VGAGVLATGNLGALFTAPSAGAAPSGVGPLRRDPAGLLDLPDGFSYSIVSTAGEALPNGGIVPDRFDGTGAFRALRGGTRLVRNSEQSKSATYPALASPALTYDPGCFGGTTTVTLERLGRKADEYVSLAGTYNNCAGGITPWGTWLTCEETEVKAGSGLARDHGYVFEVDPANPTNNLDPTPLTAMGRFPHEAVAVDRSTCVAYLTEDAKGPFGLLYRFTPANPSRRYGAYRAGGVLEALSCSKHQTHVSDLSVFQVPGERLDVRWLPVPDPSASPTSTRKQFSNGQVTRSQKFEGAWWGTDDKAYIVCSFARTSDGAAADHDGQVWSYDPDRQALRLEVRFAVNPDPSSDRPDGPDNITVTPRGDIVLAEDGEGVQHLYVVNKQGSSYPFARNARDEGEFTGVVFSGNGQTMFANLQAPGVTFAITGPFATLHKP